jgi:hypothetical protein
MNVDFTQNECIKIVEEARDLLLKTNDTIASKSAEELPGVLAHPSPLICFYCTYRPACRPYWNEFKFDAKGWPNDILGIVNEIKILGNSKIILVLRTKNGFANIPGLSPLRHPMLSELNIGDNARAKLGLRIIY